MHTFALAIFSLTYFAATAQATGEPCQIANSKLDPSSHKFRSDCGPQDYCAVSLANTGSISAAIKPPPSSSNDAGDDTPAASDGHQRRSSYTRRHHFSGFTAHKHEVRLSRRGLLQNVFLNAVADVAVNDTTSIQAAEEGDTPMINEKDGGASSPFGVNATGTCQPKGCRKDEFPFGYAYCSLKIK